VPDQRRSRAWHGPCQSPKKPRSLKSPTSPHCEPGSLHRAAPWPPRTLTLQHAPICSLRHRIHVGRHLVALLTPVHLHNGLRVDGKLLVRVDDHTEQAGVRLHRARAKQASVVLRSQGSSTGPPGTVEQVEHCTICIRSVYTMTTSI
jgi:hypothetical protein